MAILCTYFIYTVSNVVVTMQFSIEYQNANFMMLFSYSSR